MRLAGALLFALCGLTLGLPQTARAAGVYYQQGLLSVASQGETLGEVLLRIEEVAGLSISFSGSVAQRPVYARFENLPLREALKKILEGTSYMLSDDPGGRGLKVTVLGERDARPLSVVGGSAKGRATQPGVVPSSPMPAQQLRGEPSLSQGPEPAEPEQGNQTATRPPAKEFPAGQ